MTGVSMIGGSATGFDGFGLRLRFCTGADTAAAGVPVGSRVVTGGGAGSGGGADGGAETGVGVVTIGATDA
jgi:hypothetical protein